MSEPVDQSGTYPIKHGKPEVTPHKDPEDHDIKIIEELSEKVKLGISNGRCCLIIDDQVTRL
jgi:hypothetical protein